MPAPVKKKYSREHIAYLIIICSLKQALPISDIKDFSDIKCFFMLNYFIKAMKWNSNYFIIFPESCRKMRDSNI